MPEVRPRRRSREAQRVQWALRSGEAIPQRAVLPPTVLRRCESACCRRCPSTPLHRSRGSLKSAGSTTPGRTSWAAQRKAHHIASVVKALNPVHQSTHQEQPSTVLAHQLLGSSWIDQVILQLESTTFVPYLQHEFATVNRYSNEHRLAGVFPIAAEDCIGQRFSQRNRNVQCAITFGE